MVRIYKPNQAGQYLPLEKGRGANGIGFTFLIIAKIRPIYNPAFSGLPGEYLRLTKAILQNWQQVQNAPAAMLL